MYKYIVSREWNKLGVYYKCILLLKYGDSGI